MLFICPAIISCGFRIYRSLFLTHIRVIKTSVSLHVEVSDVSMQRIYFLAFRLSINVLRLCCFVSHIVLYVFSFR